MRKRLVCLWAVLTLLTGLWVPALAAPASQVPVYVDGEELETAAAVVDNGVTYVSLYFTTLALRSGSLLRPDGMMEGEDFLLAAWPGAGLSGVQRPVPLCARPGAFPPGDL